MRFLVQKMRRFASALIAGVLIVGFVLAPTSPFFETREAEAQWAVFDGANVIQNTMTAISTGASAVSDDYLALKESVLDGIAYALINAVVEQMIREATAWVASGFKGKPAFLENLGDFLGDLADNLVGNFIWESDTLAFLCSPFSLDIKIALDIQYSTSRDYQMNASQCSLSGAIGNVQGSLKGFMDKGWQDWFQVTMNQDNNPYGAVYKAQNALSANLATSRNNETKTLEFGSGFFSQKDENGKIITPGQTIQVGIANALNVPNERLAFADEINELFGALLTQLVRGVLSEASGGLSGLGSSGGSGGSIFDDPEYASSTGNGLGQGFSAQFTADRTREEQIIALAGQGVSVVDTALTRRGCDAELHTQLTSARSTLSLRNTEAQQHLSVIAQYQARLNESGISASAVQQIINEYLGTVRPSLHSTQDLAELKASLTNPPSSADEDALQAMAEAGNIIALAKLYEESCD